MMLGDEEAETVWRILCDNPALAQAFNKALSKSFHYHKYPPHSPNTWEVSSLSLWMRDCDGFSIDFKVKCCRLHQHPL